MSTRLFPLVFFVVAYSCALQVAPQGGERDTAPPVLLRTTPPSGSTGFAASEIVFEFDEYLQLKDVSSKLVVSPPLRQTPNVKVRKNLLVVEMEDTLHASTTYTFNFGDAVSDLNEGNAYPELTYVVATGPLLDTLRISGSVIRAEDLKPEKNMWVMLYPSASNDSAPYLERPFYFSRTDDKGFFRILNIAPGAYRIFALSDANANYLYDDPGERIAFLGRMVTPPDSAIRMSSFKKTGPVSLSKATADGPGKIIFLFSKPDTTVSVRLLSDSMELGVRDRMRAPTGDTVVYWYTNFMADSAAFEIRLVDRIDTVQVRLSRRDTASMRKRASFQFTVELPAAAAGTFPPHQPLQFRFNHPLDSYDTSRIVLLKSGAPVALPPPSLTSPTALQYPVDWEEEQSYEVVADPGAFRDIYGLTNDTLRFRFSTGAVSDYGTIRVSMRGSVNGEASLLLLVTDDDRTVRQAVLSGDTVCFFAHIVPGNYRLKRVADRNGNGRWDSGDDLQQLQPESVMYYFDPVPVRANWDVEVKWDVSSLNAEPLR